MYYFYNEEFPRYIELSAIFDHVPTCQEIADANGRIGWAWGVVNAPDETTAWEIANDVFTNGDNGTPNDFTECPQCKKNYLETGKAYVNCISCGFNDPV